MTTNQQSSTNGNNEQLELIELTDLQAEAAMIQPTEGEYTGLRLKEHHPRIYTAIVRLLAVPMGVMAIARLLGVSTKTVAAVRSKEPRAIAIEKKYLADQWFSVAGLALERAHERLLDPEVEEKVKDLLIGAGIGSEKGLLLAGEATTRLEITQIVPEHEDYVKSLKTIEAEATEMDLEGKTLAQKGEARALPAARVEDGKDQGMDEAIKAALGRAEKVRGRADGAEKATEASQEEQEQEGG